jgi:hypothetical protein
MQQKKLDFSPPLMLTLFIIHLSGKDEGPLPQSCLEYKDSNLNIEAMRPTIHSLVGFVLPSSEIILATHFSVQSNLCSTITLGTQK